MRTGLEVTQIPSALEELEELLRQTGAALVDALTHVPIPDQVPPLDRTTVQDIRWHVAEALRLNRLYRRRLVDRLAGATPEQSHHASCNDPPHATCQPEGSPP